MNIKKIKIITVILFVIILSAFNVYAEGSQERSSSSPGWRDTSVSSAPRIINSKIIHVPARDSGLMDSGMWEEWVVIRVELCEETGGNTPGQRYTFLTVTGLMHPGGRIETLSGSRLQWYQSNYGGRRSEYEYDNIP